MHFSIPETEECRDDTSSYTLYRIHINGAHHCSVRFSQLLNLNDQLKKEFEPNVPSFPPKKMFSLSPKEKEERRYHLEKFLQQISQLPSILNSDSFINFFINAQKETEREPETEVDFVVYLLNFEKLVVKIRSYEQTEDVLDKVMSALNVKQDFYYYFGLYLVKKDEDDESSLLIVRKLQEFESPYFSLKAANAIQKHRIILRKSVFDLNIESNLFNDDAAVDLLFIQALEELSKKWILPEKAVLKELEKLKDKGAKKEFMKLISAQKFYGYLHFKPAVVDYPEPETKTAIALGNKVLSFRTRSKNAETETVFKVTRIKKWKVSGIRQTNENGIKTPNLMLSMEYLFGPNDLKWINIKSEQSILISMSLQSMVDEILLRRNGRSIKKPSERHRLKATPFLTRNKMLINQDLADAEEEHLTPMREKDLADNDDFISNDDL